MTRRLSSLRDELSSRADDLVALRRDLHRFPELAFAETRTAARIADQLTRAGLEVTTGIATTGVVGVLRGDLPGRTIAWRADMDALPIVERNDVPYSSVRSDAMHACGHDGHVAIAVTLAEAFAAVRAQLHGTLVFVFQPAEEVFGGAQPMIDAGVLERHAIQEIYGLHLVSRIASGTTELCAGVAMAAADVLEIEVHGRGGHGASPDLVVDPIAVAAQLLAHIQDVLGDAGRDPRAVLSIGQIVAGTAFNVIPDLAKMKGSLRTLAAPDRREILDRLTGYVERVATAGRARAVVKEVACCPALTNPVEHTEHVRRCASAELGDVAVVDGTSVMASDDMALFLAQRPGCYFRVGAAPAGRPPPGHHTADFDIDEAALLVGARVASALLIDALGR